MPNLTKRVLPVLIACLAAGLCSVAAADDAASSMPETLEGHGGPVRSVAIAADNTHVLTSSFDYSAIYWLLEAQKGRELMRLEGHDAAVNDAAFVPGGDIAVTASDDGSVAVWNLDTGEMLKRFQGPGDKVLAVDVSGDGRYAASAGWDRRVRLYDLKALEEVAAFEGHRGNVNDVAFSPDGKTLYSASYDGTIHSWDVEERKPGRPIYSHGWGLNIVRALPDGKALLFGSLDGSAGVVDIESGNVLVDLAVHKGPILSADIAADAGMALVGGADGVVRVYRMADWILLHTFENPNGPIWGASLAADGTAAMLAGLDDAAFLWQISPRKSFEPPLGEFPRRFQVSSDAGPGELQFARKCSVCHTLTKDGANRAGPSLHGVFGRKAGTLEGYVYSDALKNSDIVWNEETIARLFDDGPDVVTPGSKMPVQRLKSVEDRDALIAFLKRATDPAASSVSQ
ncbi:MAG: c-type cytochrome [Rhodobiaceae bacterium]|nr:c-type cytochrome [Rhodobiaceae bacterium]MCC0049672.1 c-type cytochrome [Rhodobiaceae bacterium]